MNKIIMSLIFCCLVSQFFPFTGTAEMLVDKKAKIGNSKMESQTDTLQQIISNSKSGDIIKLNAKYNLTETINIDQSNITIDGLKEDNSLTEISINKAAPIFKIKEGVGSVTLKNIILKGTLNIDDPVSDKNGKGVEIEQGASKIKIDNLYIEKMSGCGIYAEDAKDIEVDKTKIQDFGYAGFLGFSVENVYISNSVVDGARSFAKSTIGDTKLAYNISFSRKSETDIKKYPRSKNCTVINSRILNNKTWEGLDTHGGENIRFINNTISHVKIPIAAVPSEVKGKDVYAPKNIEINDNVIDYQDSQFKNTVDRGIILSGAIDVNGSEKEYATGSIKNNKVSGYGYYDSYNGGKLLPTGSIFLQGTKKVEVSGNSVYNSHYHGIAIYYDNLDFLVKDNIIDGLYVKKEMGNSGDIYDVPSGIIVRSILNSGMINGNKIVGQNSDKTLKIRGISVMSTKDVQVTARDNQFDEYIHLPYFHMRYNPKTKIYENILQ